MSSISSHGELTQTEAMTRNFVVVCHNTSDKAAWGQFDPNNLLAGRVDVWCRVISNALYYSDGIRKTVRVWLLLHPTGTTIEVIGAQVKGLAPNEKTIALQLQQALQAASLSRLCPTHQTNWQVKSERNAKEELQKWLRRQPGSRGAVPGIHIHVNESLDARIDALRRESAGTLRMLLLDVDGTETLANAFAVSDKVSQSVGESAEGSGGRGDVVVVLGDSYGLTAEEVSCVKAQPEVVTLSLGKLPLLASQCIVILNHSLDN